ncbi:MAG TPA: transposase [Xanthomonadaceae bacterium]|jgi:putative transposase|nr:transposase [Xanthomonadaceae bacterium]
MPRRARLELPGVPLHVTQRGVNRGATFVDDDDCHHYLHLLRNFSQAEGLSVHAYVLMGNHVHLLLSSPACGLTSRLMHDPGQCHTQAFNRRHGRSGTLWQGRFKSCLVDSDRYLLTVYRYIELNPVRAAMVAAPELYRWSSVHANLDLRPDSLVTPHANFLAMGSDVTARAAVYRQWLSEGTSKDALTSKRKAPKTKPAGRRAWERLFSIKRDSLCRLGSVNSPILWPTLALHIDFSRPPIPWVAWSPHSQPYTLR